MNSILSIVHIILIGGIVWLILRREDREFRLHGFISLLLKIAAGLVLGYYYFTSQGGGDTSGFHYEALQLSAWGKEDPGAYLGYLFGNGSPPFDLIFSTSPRAEWFSKWISLIYLAGPGEYWLASVYCSFFAWTGLWHLGRALLVYSPEWKNAVFLSLLYYPSVVFWSSGLTKESIAVAAIGWMLAMFVPVPGAGKLVRYLGRIAVILIMFFIIWQVKYYYAAVMALSLMIGWLVASKQKKFGVLMRIALGLSIIVAGWITLGLMQPNLQPDYLPKVIFREYQQFEAISEPARYIEYSTLCPEWGCIVTTFPYAVVSGIYLPLPVGAWNKYVLIAGIENCFLIILTITFLLGVFKWSSEKIVALRISGWIYCILLAGFLAMSAPNLGTLIRFRVGFLPVFLLLITINNVYFWDLTEKFRQRIQKLLK